MKIWNSFGSAHSANITIVGEFKDGTEIDLAERILVRTCQSSGPLMVVILLLAIQITPGQPLAIYG